MTFFLYTVKLNRSISNCAYTLSLRTKGYDQCCQLMLPLSDKVDGDCFIKRTLCCVPSASVPHSDCKKEDNAFWYACNTSGCQSESNGINKSRGEIICNIDYTCYSDKVSSTTMTMLVPSSSLLLNTPHDSRTVAFSSSNYPTTTHSDTMVTPTLFIFIGLLSVLVLLCTIIIAMSTVIYIKKQKKR